ncbi:unnamed protein product [Ectocarpus sp. 12 AP-2014]
MQQQQQRGCDPRASGRPLCPQHQGTEGLKQLLRFNGEKVYYCTGDGGECCFNFTEDASGKVIKVDQIPVDDTPARRYEPVTDGGGSSSAGIRGDPLAAWTSSGGGVQDAVLSAFRSSGGGTSAPGGTRTSLKGKGKARARGTRHLRNATHGDIDEQMAERTSGLAANPAAGGKSKRKSGWNPVGSMGVGTNDPEGVLAGEAKRDEEETKCWRRSLSRRWGGRSRVEVPLMRGVKLRGNKSWTSARTS